MASVAKYREEIVAESGTLVSDSYSVESDATIAQLLMQQKLFKANCGESTKAFRVTSVYVSMLLK